MFTKSDINEGIIQIPKAVEINEETVGKILKQAGINNKILDIGKPHVWIMQSQRIYLDDGRCLLLKIGANSDWTDESSILSQLKASEMITGVGISQPRILAFDSSPNEYGFAYILSEKHRGKRLCDIYDGATKVEREKLYETIGQAYSLIHSIKNEWSGVWDGDPDKRKYPIHPSEFYSMAEFHNGSARYLLDKGIISKEIFEGLCSLWDENIEYMKKRPSSLVHVSPFPWSIYLIGLEGEFTVEGFAALGDFMWWDPMADVAHLLYPPFMDISDQERQAFLNEYKYPIDYHAINLYKILNRLCAMSGCYLPPVTAEASNSWIQKEVEALREFIIMPKK